MIYSPHVICNINDLININKIFTQKMLYFKKTAVNIVNILNATEFFKMVTFMLREFHLSKKYCYCTF